MISPRIPGQAGAGAEQRLLRDLEQAAAGPSGRPPLRALGLMGGYEGEFVVDLGAPLCGRDVRAARDVLKRADPYGVRVRELTGPLHRSEEDTVAYLRRLVRAGLLSGPNGEDRRGSSWERHDYRSWKLTPAGRVLAFASGRKPSSRRRADALAAGVVRAAAAINDDPDATLYWVKEIRAVGALADPDADPVLHVDLAVTLRPRLSDPVEQAKAEHRRHDAAEDRGERDQLRDMVGYGHFQTRLALAGRSKVVCLFMPYEDTDGPLLFHEDRDLTIQATPTAPYARPADPGPLTHCSWCRRDVPAERVAPPGRPVSASPLGLCETCMILGGAARPVDYHFGGERWTAEATVTTLAGEPHHATGCALCGRTAPAPRLWWPHRDDGDEDSDGTLLRLCDICPGLLHLVDGQGREPWWSSRFHDACLSGMHARLRQETGLPEPAAHPAKPRRPARLTGAHHEMLAEIRRSGVMSVVDFSRDAHHQDAQARHHWSWWDSRIGHLLDHSLLTPLTTGHSGETAVRILRDDELDLSRRVFALHTPGPEWDGSCVREPEPPAGWTELNGELTALRGERDAEALRVRAQVRPPTTGQPAATWPDHLKHHRDQEQ